MIGPLRALSFFQPVLVVIIVIFVIVNLYGFFTREEYDDDDTVTITFNCKQVLGNQENFPEFVIQQCKQMRMQ